MGYLRNEFRLTGNNHYPLLNEIVARLKNSTGLDLSFSEEEQFLSYKSLRNGVTLELLDNQKIEMQTSVPGYLWWHLTFIFIEMTIDLGGGEGVIDTLSLDDPPPVFIQAGEREKVYKYFWLTTWNTLEWAKQPFHIAKNMDGYEEL